MKLVFWEKIVFKKIGRVHTFAKVLCYSMKVLFYFITLSHKMQQDFEFLSL